MRKIKSLVNQVRQFPEYLNALDTLNILIDSEKKCAEACQAVYGNDFIKFYSKQPKSLQPYLTEIRITGEKQATLMKQEGNDLITFKTEFGELNLLNNEIQRKLIIARDAQNTATKSQIAAVKAPSDLNSQKAAEDSKRAESVKSKSDKEVDGLKKRFVGIIADSLKKVSQAQIQIANQYEELSKQFATNAAEIKDYKDVGLARLAQRLQQLDYEIAE